jgi:hypothetical protein
MSEDNPWTRLPHQPPFVLAEDRPLLDGRGDRSDIAVDTTLIPEPFLGDPAAAIVLLNLNPGWSGEDAWWHAQPTFREASLLCLQHQSRKFPFFLLDPRFSGAPGNTWWNRKLKPLVERCGIEVVARSLFCLELFPYHSKRFGHRRLRLPSQEYSLTLLREAIARNALVVVMRSLRLWCERVPELTAADLVQVSSVQNPVLSELNLGDRFHELITKIGSSNVTSR